jgi:glucose/arabinose dehydrogenase
MKTRLKMIAAACAVTGLLAPSMAEAAPKGPPPLPKATSGAKVKRFATGVAVPTQIAFSGGKAFVAGAAEGPMKGGVYVVRPRKKKAVPIRKSPTSAFGIAARGGSLFVSSGRHVIRYTGWNGKGFRRSKKIFSGPKNFTGFGGMSFGPDGRLYAGVALNQKYDREKDPSLYGNSVVSMTTEGEDIEVLATGMRQPWMLTFARGNPSPFVSVLGPDTPRNNDSPDLIVNPAPGDDYGFPACDRADASACEGFAEPLVTLKPKKAGKRNVQPSPMGIGAIGDDLYVAEFSAMKVVTLKTDGTGIKPFLTRFVAPVLSVATHKGKVYAGDLTGTIYEVKG